MIIVILVLLVDSSVSICNYTILKSWVAPSDCLLTVSAFFFKSLHPPKDVKTLSSRYCSIDYFYWVSDIVYDDATLDKDKQYSYPQIIRSNVERDGYLSFIAPLLYNSTYTLIIDSEEGVGTNIQLRVPYQTSDSLQIS